MTAANSNTTTTGENRAASLLARRLQHIAPFRVMEVVARARALEDAGRSIIHMEVGEPDFTTAAPIIAAGQQALADGHTRYTTSRGILPLRQAIAGHYQTRYGITVPVERIIVTPGASGALLLACAALLNAGDEVLLADPSYPCNRHFVAAMEGAPKLIPVGPEQAYQLSPELVERHWTATTKAVMLASPSNPTGTLIDPAVQAEIVRLAARNNGFAIVDEIYHGLTYDGDDTTALAVDNGERALVINSFSKYFGMTGWRLGWLVAPPELVPAIDKLAQNLFISASSLAQYAALAAFQPDTIAICEQRRAAFRERRDYLYPALKELGFDIPLRPAGAFYLYADCGRFSDNSEQFALRVLDDAGVAITPGTDFGHYRANRHLRFAYTNSLENLAEGIDRLRRLLL